MFVPFLLFLASLALGLTGALLPGLTDLLLLAVPCAVASLFLLLRAWLSPEADAPPEDVKPKSAQKTGTGWFSAFRDRAGAKPNWVVVDGSNVMHWKDGEAKADTVIEVLNYLSVLGFTPGIVFDANAGYKIAGRYLHDHAFSRLLGMPEDRVMVVGKGTPADPVVLAAARDLGARIVSNDRYRDWAEAHPEIRTPGHLIKGGYRDGALWLDLP